MFSTKCRADGCDKSANMLTSHCAFHEAISSARELEPEAFDRLCTQLATTVPLTAAEKRARSVKSALRSIEWSARDLKRNKEHARMVGATPGQIEAAVTRGKQAAK